LADHWVLSRLNDAKQDIEQYLASYRFAEAAETVYHVIWDDVADWYIEASKQALNAPLLAYVLETCLKISHPFAPFVTETIWTTLEWSDDLLITSRWPKIPMFDEIAAGEFEQIKALVIEARYIVSELPGKKYPLLYENDTLIADNEAVITHLAKLEAVTHVERPKGLRLAVPNREAWLNISEEELYDHQSRLELRLAEVRKRIDALESRLANKSYVEHAPKRVVEETREQLDEQEALYKRLSTELEVL